MNITSDIHDYEVPNLVNKLIRFVGRNRLEKCLDKFTSSLQLSGQIFREYYLKTRHPWWEAFIEYFARRYMQWLYQARKRYGLAILNYMITSNHIHLLVVDTGKGDDIPKSMQLIAGRTGQEYNQRKNRRGAFWEDRYHATAVETGGHLARCLVYIDKNMVRAGIA